ncbi:MAG: tetratricopeptide repeat protein [Pseudomonadales bacterium]|jgi:tetratricopeptide (TPR) repeat protein
MFKVRTLLILVGLVAGSSALAAETSADLERGWAHATYELTADDRGPALDSLGDEATALVAAHPGEADLLIWQGIILSSYAGEAGGFSALGAAKRARKALQRALEIDPDAMNGSAYTSLGALYYKVPGWPIGFGDDKKARAYLQEGLTMDPDGIDSNYFMGEFLYQNGEVPAAIEHLEKALHAPDRPGRQVADAGRRQEVRMLLDQIQSTD